LRVGFSKGLINEADGELTASPHIELLTKQANFMTKTMARILDIKVRA